MKYIIYILIALFLVQILASAIPNTKSQTLSDSSLITENKNSITIYCTDTDPSASEILTSAQIIENRLKAFGIKHYKVSSQVKEASISVDFKGSINIESVKSLLTTKGKIEFYETENVVNFITKISEDLHLDSFQVVSDKEQVNPDVLGFSKTKSKVNLDQELKLYSANKHQLLWNYSTEENGMYALHLLKANAFLNNNDISKSSVKQNEINEINISFTKAGSTIFEQATKNNIGLCIAFVIDKEVYFTPMVHSIIEGGKCTISGGFSVTEALVMHALISNPELPLNFNLR